MDTPQNVYKALNYIYDHRPVLLRSTPLVSHQDWNFDAMAAAAPQPLRAAGPRTEDEVEIQCSDRTKHRFIECDISKNLAVGPYFLREPETQHLEMTVREFVQCAAKFDARRVMLKIPIMRFDRSTAETGQVRPVTGPMAGPAAALHSAIDWAWFDNLRKSQGFGPVLRVDLEAGTTGGLQPARYSLQDELLAQLQGRRRVLLIPPSAAFEGMFPYPVTHPYDTYSMVNLEVLDAGQWPGCTQVRGLVAVLRPGDVLHVPAFWFAHQQDLEKESATLRFVLHQGTRAPDPAAASLRLSRVVEERVAAVEGPSAVRRWISLIGAGTEGSRLDLGTVAGYRRAMMCQNVRDEVEESLGAGAWAALLPAMCRNRLMPTPWLNKDFREPLLLTDTPLVIQDTRSEEEKRYPALFRRKLEGEGWSVAPSVSTVPIPGVNVP